MYKYILRLNNKKVTKVIAIIAIIFILLILIYVVRSPAAIGYEISIYAMYPWYFWLLFFLSNACGTIIIMKETLEEKESYLWLIGCGIIILCNGIFLGIPFFREYLFYPKGDALTHIGFMKDIITTGQFGDNNYYPIIHILGVILLYFNNLSFGHLTNLLFIHFYILYLLNMYLLAKVVTSCRKQILLTLAFSSPLIFSNFHTFIHPNIFSIFMIPLIMYLYHNKEKSPGYLKNNLLLLILTLFITFTHPVSTIFLIIIIFIFVFSKKVYLKIPSNYRDFRFNNILINVADYKLLKMLIVAFIGWYLSYSFIKKNILAVYRFFSSEGEVSLFDQQLSVLKNTDISFFETIKLFLFKYGGVSIYLLLSVFALIGILKYIFKSKQINLYSLTYFLQFIAAILFSVFSLFAFTGEYNVFRITRFFLFMSPLIIGLGFYKLFFSISNQSMNKRILFITFAYLIILLITLLNILNVYGSSRVMEPNLQVTRMEVSGMEWFNNHENNEIITATIGVDPIRIEDFLFGFDYPYLNRTKLDKHLVNSHFGYNENHSIAETYNFEDRYMLITEAGRVYINLIPEIDRYKAHQYTESDFNLLSNDSTTAKIYVNSEFEIWKLTGKNNK